MYLQLKLVELEEELERAARDALNASKEKEKEKQGVEVVALAPSATTGEKSFAAMIAQPVTDHEPTLKSCEMCRRSVAHSNKSELR